MSSSIISQDQISSFEILQKQIDEIKNEICDIKHKNSEILRNRNTDKEEIESIKKNIHILSQLVSKLSKYNEPIKSINTHFEVKNIYAYRVCSLIELKDKRIITGGATGDSSIYISEINYDTKEWKITYKLEKAHDDAIFSLIELSDKRLISGSLDKMIKMWNISNPDDITLIHTFYGHEYRVWKVIPLSDNRIASCSNTPYYAKLFNGEIKIWELEHPYNLTNFKCEQAIKPFSMIQLKEQNDIICVSCKSKNNYLFGMASFTNEYLNFYEINPPFKKRGSIEGIFTYEPNGLIELSNQDIAVSCKTSIVIVDSVLYIQKFELSSEEYITGSGSLFELNYNCFLFARGNCFCQIFMKNGNYNIVYQTKSEDNIYGNNILLTINDGNYVITEDGCRGCNILKYT
jgi:WD40 repeat protein